MANKATLKKKLAALAVGAPLLSVGFVGLSVAPAAALTQGEPVDLIDSTDAYLSPDASAEAEGQIQPGLGYIVVEPDAGNGFVGIAYQEDPSNVFYVERSALGVDDEDTSENGNGENGNGGAENGGNGEELEAYLSVSVDSIAPGESVALTGAGFDASERVNISLGTEYPAFITVDADEDGLIDYNVTIPTDVADGQYEVIAEGVDSGVTVSTTLTVLSEDATGGDVDENVTEGDGAFDDDREARDGFVEQDYYEGNPADIEAGFVGGDNSNPAALAGLLLGGALLAGGTTMAMRRKEAHEEN